MLAVLVGDGRAGTGVRGFGGGPGGLPSSWGSSQSRPSRLSRSRSSASSMVWPRMPIGPVVAAVADDPEQAEVVLALAQRKDLPADLVAAGVHAVEVQASRYGFISVEQGGEAVEMVVAVVQVVDDADVRRPPAPSAAR